MGPVSTEEDKELEALNAAKVAKARESWYGGKPGPKVFVKGEDFITYWMQRLEKERSDIDGFIKAYAKQPFFLRCQLVHSEGMRQIWDAIVADVALGVQKLKREQWTALSKILDMQRSLKVEEEKSERKRINKENSKRSKSGTEIMTSLVVETENEGD